MSRFASDLRSNVVLPTKRDLLDVEWFAILIAIVVVCVTAFALDAIL